MKNIVLLVGHKNSYYFDYFCENFYFHKNIQKTQLESYDKLDKLFLAQKTRSDYLKNPKFYCEKLECDYQLSFKPFLDHLFFIFVIDKPKNVINDKDDKNYYQLRLRRIYELIVKTKNKKVFFEEQVFKKETYQECKEFLNLKSDFKLKKQNNSKNIKYEYDQNIEDFYDKYKYMITKYL